MYYLNSTQRSLLERVVVSARNISEIGARNALKALAIDNSEPFSNMSPEQRTLRNRLRHKGRLLGDILVQEGKAKGEQSLDKLSSELSYEYWHKMLFAKFLEVNNLLMHSSGVAITMAECEELADEEGYLDKWQAASVYASKMLPAIFRPDDPLMAVEFATEDRIKLEKLLESIPDEIYKANDSLGWVYQFWQSEAKARINASGDKIAGEKLPAVTQLFTEPYMVHFLIDNTVGAWWVSRNLDITPPIIFEYLRTLEDGKPAAGNFEGWPDKTADITSLDPCMGSGHFIVSLFEVFVNLRMYEENLSKEDATDKVIKDNLYGLEIDPRCTQLAAFNLALTAWKFCGKHRELPEMNLACSGIAPKGKKEDWVKLVGDVRRDDQSRMENGMKVLYDHFQLAPELGSLLDPSTIKADTFTASFEELQPTLLKALENERDTEQLDRGVMAAGIAKAGQILAKKYTLQITNVPYLSRGSHGSILANYCEKNYSNAKSDLATVFLSRLLQMTSLKGVVSIVLPQNWLFMKTYKSFRIWYLKNTSWNFLSRLGPGAFSQISGEVVKAILFSISNVPVKEDHHIIAIDVSDKSDTISKNDSLKINKLIGLHQLNQIKNPDSKFILKESTNFSSPFLREFSRPYQGIKTGDDNKSKFFFWECLTISNWALTYGGPSSGHKEGSHYILNWENKGKDFARFQGKKAFNKLGFYVTNVGKLQSFYFYARPFTSEITVLIPNNSELLLPIAEFLSSKEYETEMRMIDQNLAISTASVGNVPFDLEYWQKIATEKYPNGLPKPYTDDATQWIFHGHPVKADDSIQVAVARFLGYRWPAESDTEMELSEEARDLINEISKYNSHTDNDGIVCIPPVNGELTAADRLRDYLASIYGSQWSHNAIEELLKKEGSRNKDLENYLRDEFFEQHFKLFQNRPFIWQIWDGRKDGFSVLVNYHKLTKEALQKIIYTYLGDWIRQCEAKLKNNESGAEGLLLAAQSLKTKLEIILKGEKPYDIFVRWKTIDKQPVGWDPDLNDGVRLNIRPFVEAGILRKQPKIKWGIDRGKNPPGSPWGEIRDNDIHLTLKEKLEAREKSIKKTS